MVAWSTYFRRHVSLKVVLKGYGKIFSVWLNDPFEVIVITVVEILVACLVSEIWKDK